jgi:xanthine/CO dehydrogenase XdhC/CoxF family maturation factor
MDEIDTILHTYTSLSTDGGKAALATLVHVSGAAFRRVGARMLIAGDGRTTGAITAGCIETDIVEKSRAVVESGSPIVVRYDTGSEKEILFGWGSGCQGVLSVLIEPVQGNGFGGALPYLAKRRLARETATIATIYDVGGSTSEFKLGRHLFDSDAIELASIENDHDGPYAESRTLEVDKSVVHALVEQIPPPNRLVIFGAGAVSEPLALFANETGWEVKVIERRSAFADQSRFHKNVELICTPYESVGDVITLDTSTAVVITTHNFLDDCFLMKKSIASSARAIAVLSSRRRAANLIETIEAEDGPLDSTQRERIYAPAGIDIGGDTPSRIALSIIAQLSQIFSGAGGGALRDKIT